jgi:hypothetical protein
MRQSLSQQRLRAYYLDSLDRALIHSGLAELVPLARRRREIALLQLALLVLWALGLIGLPVAGVLLSAVLALTIEALEYGRQQLVPLPKALARPVFWERIRPSLYWPLLVGIVLTAVLSAQEALLLGLSRGIYQWLCLRVMEDTVAHPERYGSLDEFLSQLERFWQQIVRAWAVWAGSVILAIAIGFTLNLIATGIWESIGTVAWNRLLIFGGGLYLLAMFAFARAIRPLVRSAIQDAAQNGDGFQAQELDRVLISAGLTGEDRQARTDLVDLFEEKLRWKNAELVVARASASLQRATTHGLRWSGFVGSLLACLLAFLFIVFSMVLIVPRGVMERWVFPGQLGEEKIFLAFEDLEELTDEAFLDQLLQVDATDLAQEPLPKIAFLEATVIASLVLLRTVTSPSTLRSLADLEPWSVQRRIQLGAAYLILLENDFQYLRRGFATRQLASERGPKIVTLKNEILLAPSVATKASVYRALTDYLQVYGPMEGNSTPHIVTVFADYQVAQKWSARFLRSVSPALEQVADFELQTAPTPDSTPTRFWLWSGEQLVALTSLQEAQWYGRFVAH